MSKREPEDLKQALIDREEARVVIDDDHENIKKFADLKVYDTSDRPGYKAELKSLNRQFKEKLDAIDQQISEELANVAPKSDDDPDYIASKDKIQAKKEKLISLLNEEYNKKVEELKEKYATELQYKIAPKLKRKNELVNSDVLLSVRHLKEFFVFGSKIHNQKLKAVSNVSFDVYKGECFGIVGESGCGKTTTGRTIIKLYKPTSGSIYYKGYRIGAGDRWNKKEIKWSNVRYHKAMKNLNKEFFTKYKALDKKSPTYKEDRKKLCAGLIENAKNEHNVIKKIRKAQRSKIRQIAYDNRHVPKKLMSEIQMIFQDPIDSLDPRMTVESIIQEGLIIQGQRNKKENHKKVVEMLEKVGLVEEHASRYPHEFSGGQRQRIGIARALIMNPKLLICDEPISALDVSIRAQIINLLNDLKEEMGLTLIFIAHDLSVVKYFCDRIAVMYFGKIVELASSNELFKHPLHPYTESLLSAIPKPNPLTERHRTRIVYNPQTAHDYSTDKPSMREVCPGHMVYCNEKEFKDYQERIKKLDKKAKKE